MVADELPFAAAGVGCDPCLVDPALAEPLVVADAELQQILLDAFDDEVDAAQHHLRRRFGGVGVGVGGLVLDALRQVDHVVAGIAVLRDLDFPAEELLIASEQRAPEDFGLGAGVVHEILALDGEAGGFEHGREHAADGGAAAVAGGERAGGVGADELDLHALALAERDVAERSRRRRRSRRPVCASHGSDEAEVDEAGGRDIGRGERVARGQARGDGGGDIEGFGACGAREAHRQVGGVVAVLRSRGALDDDLRQDDVRQLAGRHRCLGGRLDHARDVVADHARSNGKARSLISRSTSSTAERARSMTSAG